MCYIFRCCGWILDLLQRILTFLLACIMSSAICIGITLAVGAGIAYGYNWSLAEFLTFTRSDVTVYVRRGQFADRPEVRPNSRRFGDNAESEVLDGNELFSSNFTADYQETNKIPSDDSKPLSDAWQKAQDSRTYADKLTKYSKIKTAVRAYPRAEEEEMVTKLFKPNDLPDDSSLYIEETHQDDENDDSTKKPTLSTSTDDQPISRRNFDLSNPLNMDTQTESERNKSDVDIERFSPVTTKKKKHRHKKLRKPDIKIEVADHSKSLYLQPQYNISNHASDIDYSEYSMYKPV